MWDFTVEDKKKEGYVDRVTVKAVIVDSRGNMLTFGPMLVGGGVEEGETLEEALHREAQEEVGAEIKIIKKLGQTFAFRNLNKERYVTHGFLCEYVREISAPTTTDEVEASIRPIWASPGETLARLASEIEELQNGGIDEVSSSESIDYHESRIYNRSMAMHFIRLAREFP